LTFFCPTAAFTVLGDFLTAAFLTTFFPVAFFLAPVDRDFLLETFSTFFEDSTFALEDDTFLVDDFLEAVLLTVAALEEGFLLLVGVSFLLETFLLDDDFLVPDDKTLLTVFDGDFLAEAFINNKLTLGYRFLFYDLLGT
jgi:hypothetical protein